MNRDKKEDDRKEECGGNEDQSSAVDLYRVVGVHKCSLDEPRQAKTEHVEYIWTHNVGHGHVSFPCKAEKIISHTGPEFVY